MCRHLSQYLIRSYHSILSSLAKVARQVSALSQKVLGCQMFQRSNRRNFLLEQLLKAKMCVRNRYKVPTQEHISATMLHFQMNQRDGHRVVWLREVKQLPKSRLSK